MMCRTLLLWVIAMAWSSSILAEQTDTLDQLLIQVQQVQQQETIVRQQREKDFLVTHADRKKLLSELKQWLLDERKRSKRLQATFEQNEKALAQLETEQQRKVGDFGEVFGTVRQTAKDLAGTIDESLVSAQYSGRGDWLRTLGETRKLPDSTRLEKLWHLVQQEIIESGRVVRFPATVVGSDGVAAQQEIIRVGVFNAFEQDRYLSYQATTGRFVELARQPSSSSRELAAELATTSKGYSDIALDPTRGVLLSLLVEAPEFMERIHQGGGIGYIIVALGVTGLLIVFGRLVYLTIVEKRINHQLENLGAPLRNNPLGRMLCVSSDQPDVDPKNLELQIDEAILREIPVLSRGEGLVKLIAGVAPLLGLLGTVVGMIATFQAITLFGSGDPKIMANGISQALVTTALGLIVSIPLLFMHALVSTRSKALVRVLDEQAAGMVAASNEEK